jgi:hypothetical protein
VFPKAIFTTDGIKIPPSKEAKTTETPNVMILLWGSLFIISEDRHANTKKNCGISSAALKSIANVVYDIKENIITKIELTAIPEYMPIFKGERFCLCLIRYISDRKAKTKYMKLKVQKKRLMKSGIQ